MHFIPPPNPTQQTSFRQHGTRQRYKAGCQCMLCKAANARYEVERSSAQSTGGGNCLVSAGATLRHIKALSRKGIGRRALAAASDVAEAVISRIRAGKQKKIRRPTEMRILSVSDQVPSDGALIGAERTWTQIETLLAEGFTKSALGRRLGYQSRSLQVGKTRIRARTAARVDRLFRMLMKE